MKFMSQHPVLTGFGILFGAASVVAFWPLFLAAAVLTGIGAGLWWITRTHDRQPCVAHGQGEVLRSRMPTRASGRRRDRAVVSTAESLGR